MIGDALPNLVVIGAQKCGTTALHSYLEEHPEISMSRPKELDFFVSDLFLRRMKGLRGVDWYRRHFDARSPVRGESSPNYTAEPIPPRGRRRAFDPYYRGVAERMHSLVPGAKLIYMVRDPIERVRAQWIHIRTRGWEREPLESAVSKPSSTYIARSSYCFQLERFLEHYPLDQVLVIDQGDLLHRRPHTLAAVFRFIGVDDSFWSRSYEGMFNVTRALRRRTAVGVVSHAALPRRAWLRLGRHAPFSLPFEPPEMSEAIRAELADRLSEDVARFRALTGRRFEDWSL